MKLNPETQSRIIESLKKGHTYDTAAAHADIGISTLYRWLHDGKRARSGKYRDFWEAVKKAESEAKGELVEIVKAQSMKSWQAAAWLLERRHPDEFGRHDRHKVEHTGHIKHDIEAVKEWLDAEE